MPQASLANRVYETSTTAGAGAFTLAGAATPRHRTFLGSLGAAATTFYLISHRALGEWEAGVGLVNGDGTLTRVTVLNNHLGTTATVSFSAGKKDVFQDVPASKMLALETDSNTFPVPGAIRLNTIAYTFPATQAANRFLKTDGAGNLSWALPTELLALTDLSDVAITAPVAGDVLRYSGTAWVNSTDGSTLTALNASNLASGTTGVARGGTGLGVYAIGDMLYASAVGVLSKLAAAVDNAVLTLAGGIPAWATSLVLAGTVTATGFSGPLTGNVTGNVSGTSGSTTGNAATATALATARAINGVNFDGSAAITVTAAAGTLTGAALAINVLASSLTSIGTLASGAVPASLVTAGAFGAGRYAVAAGLLADATYAFGVTGTLATTAASDQYGNYFSMTGAGAGTGAQYAMRVELLGGYTGSGATCGLRTVNNTDNAGVNFDHANFGLDGVSHGSASTSTNAYNVGVNGQARWASVSVGVRGVGTNTNGVNTKLGQTSIGMYGRANADATGKQIGGVFVVGVADPTLDASAALIADNGAETSAIFLARANSVTVVSIGATGIASFIPGATNAPGITFNALPTVGFSASGATLFLNSTGNPVVAFTGVSSANRYLTISNAAGGGKVLFGVDGGGGYGFTGDMQITGSLYATTYAAIGTPLEAAIALSVRGTPTGAVQRGMYLSPIFSAAGVTAIFGAEILGDQGAGITTTNAYGLYLHPIGRGGGGSVITNNYALYITAVTEGGTLNYAIYTNAGLVRFGDAVTATSTLTVTGGFGCNTKAAQGAYASGGALAAYGAGANGFDSGANAAALHAMVVSIRAALVANGIMS